MYHWIQTNQVPLSFSFASFYSTLSNSYYINQHKNEPPDIMVVAKVVVYVVGTTLLSEGYPKTSLPFVNQRPSQKPRIPGLVLNISWESCPIN